MNSLICIFNRKHYLILMTYVLQMRLNDVNGCKGPYHIRKRCPKLASLANETAKKKEAFNYNDNFLRIIIPKFQSNNNRDNFQYYNNGNGYNHSKYFPLNQRPNQYTPMEEQEDFKI